MSLSKAEMSARGAAGAFAKLAQYGADHAPRAMYQGRVKKALAQVDAWAAAQGEILSERERQTRADYLIKSQNRANLIKANQARQINAKIKSIANPRTACVYCATLRNKTLAPGVSHKTCKSHMYLSSSELTQLSIRADHLHEVRSYE